MNLLDENIREDQRSLLQMWGIAVRQLGAEVGQKGMKDEQIITLLHELRDVTFFTRDRDFFEQQLSHSRYCLVCLAVRKDEVAVFVRRILHHPELKTKAKRMGAVVHASHTGISIWRRNVPEETSLPW